MAGPRPEHMPNGDAQIVSQPSPDNDLTLLIVIAGCACGSSDHHWTAIAFEGDWSRQRNTPLPDANTGSSGKGGNGQNHHR